MTTFVHLGMTNDLLMVHNLARPGTKSAVRALGRRTCRAQGDPGTDDEEGWDMATDYDAPRKTDDDLSEDSIEELKSRRVDKRASSVDVDETEQAEGLRTARRRPLRRGVVGAGAPAPGGRVHLLTLLPGAPPQPIGQQPGRPDGLPGVRCLTVDADKRVAVRRLHPQAVLPAYARPGDAGADLASTARVTLEPGSEHWSRPGSRWRSRRATSDSCTRARGSRAPGPEHCQCSGHGRLRLSGRDHGQPGQPRPAHPHRDPSRRPDRAIGHPGVRRGDVHRSGFASGQ